MKIIKKVLVSIIIGLISLVLIVIVGLNVVKFIMYSDYYGVEESLCKNPGLSDGFVCQGVAISEEKEVVLVSGYMTDKTKNSRIYITDFNNKSYYVNLERNGEIYTGHTGGIAVTKDNVYIACSSKIFTVSLTEILSKNNGETIEIGSGQAVNNSASFVYSDDNYIYVGEFHNGAKYITDHPYLTSEGMYYAIVTKYAITDLTKPLKIYSIRNEVQGICFTPDGKVIVSTSYGLADSHYYIYNESEATKSSEVLDGAPVYYLDNYQYKLKAPAMSEDLDYYNGKVVTLTESASNKYIFGKLFFANKINTIDYNELLKNE